jgi:hypothetical protein
MTLTVLPPDSRTTLLKGQPIKDPATTTIQGKSGRTIPLFSRHIPVVFQHFLGGMAFQGWFTVVCGYGFICS